MHKKRYIFDLDGTLLLSDYKLEKKYFESIYGKRAEIINSSMGKNLFEYERTNPVYDVNMLSEFLTRETGINVTSDVIKGWIELVSDDDITIVPGVVEVLEYLKGKNASLAVLTNWFGKTQKMRLERAGLLEYFDDFYTGDMCLKPRRDAYMSAKDRFSPSECLFVGDNVLNDYIGPKACGMDSVLYDKNNEHHKTLIKVSNMKDIINKF